MYDPKLFYIKSYNWKILQIGYIPRGKSYDDYEKLNHKRIAFPLWHMSPRRTLIKTLFYYILLNLFK